MKTKDAYLDWLDYRGIGHRRGIEHVANYRSEYLRRYLDKSYDHWLEDTQDSWKLVRSEHIQ